jgi:hypothetical protein
MVVIDSRRPMRIAHPDINANVNVTPLNEIASRQQSVAGASEKKPQPLHPVRRPSNA